MTFLFDNNFSPNLVTMLCALDVDAVALRDRFDPSIKDVDLFPQLHGSGVVFVTADMNIMKRHVEAQALKQCEVSAVFLQGFWLRLDKWGQANWLSKHWRKTEEYVRKLDPPVYIDVASNGKITRLSL